MIFDISEQMTICHRFVFRIIFENDWIDYEVFSNTILEILVNVFNFWQHYHKEVIL